MRDGIDVQVKGLDELARGMRELGENIGEGATRAFRDVANSVRSTTTSRVPQVTGRLAASVTVEADERAGVVAVGIGDGVPYAGWIEFGGGRYRARPYIASGRYFYPAATSAEEELQPAGERAAEQEIRRIHWP